MSEEIKVTETETQEQEVKETENTVSMKDLDNEIDASFDTFRDADAEGWDRCAQYIEDGTILELNVDGIANDKGLIVNLEGLRGFVPASHIALKRVDDLNEYLGKSVRLQVIEADELNKRLILSARKLLQDQEKTARLAKIQAIEPGTIVEGVVETLKPYGAFVKIDNDVTGLIHVSQISTKRVQDPANVLKKGQSVKAKVLNTKEGKLSLSIRAILEDEQAKKEAEEKNVRLPKSEDIGSNMGDLLKGFKFD